MSALREIIKNAGSSLDSWTVMSSMTDPYRIDTRANNRNAQWLADAWKACALTEIHARGLHYSLVSMPDLIKPDGERYLNTERDWLFLQTTVNHARWLGHIDFDAITDERNAGPELYLPPDYGRCGIEVEHDAERLTYFSRMPTLDVFCQAPHASQAFRLVIVGEKSSLRNVLRPICRKYEAELILPTGELSTTLLYGIVKRAAADGRPCRLFYLSDFDPSGLHMPLEVARKIQALVDLKFPGLDIEVHRCALSQQQVKTLGLPETPLKESELRAEKWRERFGCEQTEIDALATLRADVLANIVEKDLSPYFDKTLQFRHRQAFEFAKDQTAKRIEQVTPFFQEALDEAQALIDDVVDAQAEAYGFASPLFERMAGQVIPVDPESVEPAFDASRFARPMFSSRDSFEISTSRLLGEKL